MDCGCEICEDSYRQVISNLYEALLVHPAYKFGGGFNCVTCGDSHYILVSMYDGIMKIEKCH